MIELVGIVTQTPLSIKPCANVEVIEVPGSYKTPRGTLFKARNLEYCLRKCSSHLCNTDIIVHIDEETLLSDDSVVGIINFVSEGKADFGKGLVTYTRGGSSGGSGWRRWLRDIESALCHTADMLVVADEIGRVRLQFELTGKSVTGLIKGSFIVARVGAERCLGWDCGEAGSVTEDVYFAMKSFQHGGYSFQFIEGSMWEESPCNLVDLIHQRRRWFQGLGSILKQCPEISFWYKIWPAFTWFTWCLAPFIFLNSVITLAIPVCTSYTLPPSASMLDTLAFSTYSLHLYLYAYGAMRTYTPRNKTALGVCQVALKVAVCVLCAPVISVIESAAVAYSFLTPFTREFRLIDKNNNTNNSKNNRITKRAGSLSEARLLQVLEGWAKIYNNSHHGPKRVFRAVSNMFPSVKDNKNVGNFIDIV